MKYMMANESIHQVFKRQHSIGHDGLDHTWELCHVSNEPVDGYYIGSWVEGLGVFHMLFPVESTRDLTAQEIDYFSKMSGQIANQGWFKIDVTMIDENEAAHLGKTYADIIAETLNLTQQSS